MERRQLLTRIWTWLGLAALAEGAWVITSFIRPRRGPADDAGLVTAGRLEQFDAGSVTAFPEGRFYLVRLDDGGFMALHRECTHLGCTLPWDSAAKRFSCPCHASSFDIAGRVMSAPAPRPLDYYVVRVENGLVRVDTRRRLTRQVFETSQVTGV